MADQKPADEQLDENGNPIKPVVEGAGIAPKIKSKTDEDEEAEPVIPVRRSTVQNIIARQKQTIKKLRSRGDEEEDEEADFQSSKGGEGEEDEDGLTPEARGAVQKEVQRQIGPVVKSLASKSDEDELQELLSQEPESGKYEKRIRAYMQHAQYQGVPPSVIYHHLAFNDAATIGTRRKGAANFEAAQVRGGGRTSRPADTGTGTIPSVEEQNEMTDAEFEALQHKARSGEFKPDQ